MRYVGGKSRIAGQIVQRVLENTESREVYYEPFVGGGSVLTRMVPHFKRTVAADSSEDLILMWRALQEGWRPPEALDEEEYRELRNAEPSALRGFAGYGCSFGGKWFGGFARAGAGYPRNPQSESYRAVVKDAEAIDGHEVVFVHADYRQFDPPEGAVVYCDPNRGEVNG